MEDKKQDVNSLQELVKTADSCKAFFASLADELSKVLADIKAPDEEENTWEMECPYEEGDKVFKLGDDGLSWEYGWNCMGIDESRFEQGNVFPTRQAARLEAKRRNLLTRFRAFRDECNGDWKADWNDRNSKKWDINYTEEGVRALWTNVTNSFSTFGHFKNRDDAERAIELFGDEIKELFVDCEVQ